MAQEIKVIEKKGASVIVNETALVRYQIIVQLLPSAAPATVSVPLLYSTVVEKSNLA